MFEQLFKRKPSQEAVPVPMPTHEDIITDLEARGLKIIPSTFERRAGEIDFTEFKTEDEQNQKILHSRLTDLVNSAEDYLSGPLFTDDFGTDHDARRLWERKEMFPKYGKPFTELTHTNKIAGGNIGTVLQYLTRVVSLLDTGDIHSSQAETLRELLNSFPDPQESAYNPLSLEEKLEVVSKVESICMTILDMLKPERPAFIS